jgi:nicotinamide-nucleotide amidase
VIKRAAILSTGDELTTGRIADTNAQWIADKLFELGIDVVTVVTVGDYPERLEWAWRQALSQADVVISTGGIGPTADDLTTETVGTVLGRKLVEDGRPPTACASSSRRAASTCRSTT